MDETVMIILLTLSGIGVFTSSFFVKNKENKLTEIKHIMTTPSTHDNNDKIINLIQETAAEKIKSLNEYSSLVLEEIEKKHKELLFMYQLISDKEKSLDKKSTIVFNESIKNINTTLEKTKNEKNDIKQTSTIDKEKFNYNNKILELHNKGLSVKDIAKKLKLGIGEVKLVIDLFKEV